MREVGVSSRNVVSRTFPHFSQSMLTPMSFTNTDRRSMLLVYMLYVRGNNCDTDDAEYYVNRELDHN